MQHRKAELPMQKAGKRLFYFVQPYLSQLGVFLGFFSTKRCTPCLWTQGSPWASRHQHRCPDKPGGPPHNSVHEDAAPDSEVPKFVSLTGDGDSRQAEEREGRSSQAPAPISQWISPTKYIFPEEIMKNSQRATTEH